MSQQLINRNPDLKRLRDEGYHIEVKGGYLLIHHIPYVNSRKEVHYGKLVTVLALRDANTVSKPDNHVIFFCGDFPHFANGEKIAALVHQDENRTLDEGIIVNYSFSNKPKNGFSNYYDKVKSYADIVSHQAIAIDSSVTATPFNVVIDEDPDCVFHYMDTNSSRANINLLNAKFKGQKIAIVGLGGTGAYILDMVAKTQVQEIHIFDGDDLLLHNAFRSPGALSRELLNTKPKKADYYHSLYSKMHRYVFSHPSYISEDNINELQGMSYVFVCVDKNQIRKSIIDYLLTVNIPFIDVGLGVYTIGGENDCLVGTIRATVGTKEKNDHLTNRVPTGDNDNNEYGTNIQVADLNSFNAVLAVMKWKKMSGFYQDLEKEHHLTYSINVAQLLNEDLGT